MIFEINFFLFSLALSNIWSYTCVYAKLYANITNVEFGTLAMVLPALGLFAKPIVCSLADAHTIHKQCLIGALAVFSMSYGSLAILPFIKSPDDHTTDFVAWIVISAIMSIGYVSVACIFCMNDALASNYARKHGKSYGRMRIYACAGYAMGALLVMVVGEVPWLPSRVFGCIMLTLFTVIDIFIIIFWPYPEDFEMFHDGSTVDQRKLSIIGPNTLALVAKTSPRGSISRDMLERIKEGRSKSVGGLPRVDQPGLYKTASQISTDSDPKDEQKEHTNFQVQLILMKMIASDHKSFIRYIVLFTLFGIVQSMIWNYELDFLKAKIVKDDAEFEFISTLCLIAQSVFGEILINIVASEMLKVFGSSANLSLALVTIGLRCFFYANILPYLSPATVVVAESLQGPSLGLYWVLTVDIGSNFALMVTDYMPELRRRKIVRDKYHEEELSGCLRATMIGIMSSSMEGLGVALGSLIGGVVSASMGYESMWNFCAGIGFIAGFLNIGYDLVTKLILKKGVKERSVQYSATPTVVVEDSTPTLKLSKQSKL